MLIGGACRSCPDEYTAKSGVMRIHQFQLLSALPDIPEQCESIGSGMSWSTHPSACNGRSPQETAARIVSIREFRPPHLCPYLLHQYVDIVVEQLLHR